MHPKFDDAKIISCRTQTKSSYFNVYETTFITTHREVISTTDALQHQYLRWTLTSYRAQTLIYTGLDNTSIGVSLNKTNKARGLQHSLIRIHKALTIDTCKIRGHLLPPPPKVPKVMSPNHGTHDLHIRNTVVLMKSLITYICQWSTDGKELQFNLLLL